MATISPRTDATSRLRLAVARTARRLRQESGSSLSPSLSAALATVANHGPLTPSELAARERVSRPTATKLLGRLESAGLLDRAADPQDGRSSLVSLSADGRELIAATRARKDAWLDQRLRTLTPAERATLRDASAILERVLEQDGQ